MSLLMTMLSFFFRESTNMTAFLSGPARLVAGLKSLRACRTYHGGNPPPSRQAGNFDTTSLPFIVNRRWGQSRITWSD
jgi:hypothetical protein